LHLDSAYERGVLLFLSHLRLSAEWENDALRPLLLQRVREVLLLACRDPLARDELVARMGDSVDACGDKPIWALNQMTLLAKVARARGHPDELREVGRRVMRLGVVHEHVARKIRSLGFVDDVCVYLAFEIALAGKLDLPVSAQEMKFPDYIKVSEEELLECEREALQEGEEERLEAWLLAWPEWQSLLREKSCVQDFGDIEAVVIIDAPGGGASAGTSRRGSGASTRGSTWDLAGATDLSGEPLDDPVLLGHSIWSYRELLPHWIKTGSDLNNSQWGVEEFHAALRRVEVGVIQDPQLQLQLELDRELGDLELERHQLKLQRGLEEGGQSVSLRSSRSSSSSAASMSSRWLALDEGGTLLDGSSPTDSVTRGKAFLRAGWSRYHSISVAKRKPRLSLGGSVIAPFLFQRKTQQQQQSSDEGGIDDSRLE